MTFDEAVIKLQSSPPHSVMMTNKLWIGPSKDTRFVPQHGMMHDGEHFVVATRYFDGDLKIRTKPYDVTPAMKYEKWTEVELK